MAMFIKFEKEKRYYFCYTIENKLGEYLLVLLILLFTFTQFYFI